MSEPAQAPEPDAAKGWLARLRRALGGPGGSASAGPAADASAGPAPKPTAIKGEAAPVAAAVMKPELAPPEPPAPPPPLHPLLQSHLDQVCSAKEAVAHVRSGDHVFVGTACATPRALVAALEAQEFGATDVELLHFFTDHAIPHDAQGVPRTRFRHRSFFVGADVRASVRLGQADYVPMSIARVPELIANGRIAVDVAFIQVSLPDASGHVSLGVSVDIAPAAVARARLVVAEVNPLMPRSAGDSLLHVSQIDWLVPVHTPVIEYRHPPTADAVMERIARYIGGIIDEGSTLQIGLGRVSNEALKYLADRRDIGIHSDVVTDAIIPLLEKGMLTGAAKTQQPGKIVASFAMGTRKLYDLIDGNPLFVFQPIEVVCNPVTIAAQHKMVSVTQAFAVDLTGQVCADQFNGEFYSGLAAQGEFLRGASRSAGGKPIICLASSDDDGAASRIRATLRPNEGVTVARSDVHYVITEYGIAYLFGKSIRERALALIDVAHPKFRAELFAQAQALGYVGAEQTLRHLHAYAVEEERRLDLKDGRQVLLRPAVVGDAQGIRDLFHGLSDRDVYTRFFRKIRGLSDRDVQRLCNMNFDNEVAFVACVGPRENAQVVAQSCYFIDPATQLAETAFMVHPAWQGSGLGSALQRRMAEHARQRGVRGFVAEILASNEGMIRLARGGAGTGTGTGEGAEAPPPRITVEDNGGTVRVTTVW